MKRIEVLKVERLLDEFWAVDRATVRYERPDGTMSEPVTRLSVERGDSVAALLYNKGRDCLIFVRQFRYATLGHGEPFLMETVAGKIDEGETPEQSAIREIEEEVGYSVSELTPIARMYGSPGGLSEMVYIYYAEVDDAHRPHQGNLLEGEDVTIEEISPAEAFRMLDAGEIHDSKAIIGVQWLRLRSAQVGEIAGHE